MISKLIESAERDCAAVFREIDAIEESCTARVLAAFQKERVGARHFAPTTGYGYDDIGRDTLERLFADVFCADAAIVRPHVASGTHALAMCLAGLLKPGEHLLYATGKPYDTLDGVIGISTCPPGCLREMGVSYSDVPLADGLPDVPGVLAALRPETRVVALQRSRGYASRRALLPEDFDAVIAAVRAARPDIFIMIDNCYGEFVRDSEPRGADALVGSLIKNPGGGLAPTGAYIVGTERAISRVEARLTAPGVGREVGSYAGSYRPFYQGLFMAPHTVAQAKKTAVLAARAFELLNMRPDPAFDAVRGDIIQSVDMHSPERLVAFCQGIQAASPVDSFASPEPWDMPGYQNKVVMAAGTFVSGASIELSCDAPMREPFTAYMQGALTYAHGKFALQTALSAMEAAGCL